MSTISHFLSLVITICILIAAMVFMVSPRTAGVLFKRVGILVVAFVLWLVLLERLVKAVTEAWWLPVLLLAVSIAAYCIWEALCRAKERDRRFRSRGAERIPLMPNRPEESEEEDVL